MKNPADVGADFDDYARRWRKEDYSLEASYGAGGVVVDPTRDELVQRPGDEWGDVTPLRTAYTDLVRSFGPSSGAINVVEIGAGGGRSTAVMLEALGERAGDYHVVDVSPVFIDVLKERINPAPTVHIVTDVDLSGLPAKHFDICLAQSSWSHINLYDQYRYLRELRRVLRPRGVVFVSGQFLLGLGNDWTWNRFARRVNQIDRNIHGVFHEFTSVAALTEMLTRLEYEICCINTAGFVARVPRSGAATASASLRGPVTFPFNPSPHDFLATGRADVVSLPFVGVEPQSRPAPLAAASQRWFEVRARGRRALKRVPGVRPLVLRVRTLRSPRR